MKKIIVLLGLAILITGCSLTESKSTTIEVPTPEVEDTEHNERELVCEFKDTIISELNGEKTTIVFYFDNQGILTSATYKEILKKEDTTNEIYEQSKKKCEEGNCVSLIKNNQLTIEGTLNNDDFTKKSWQEKNKESLKQTIEEQYKDTLVECK